MSLPIESYFVRGPRLTHLVGASSGSADPSASSTGGSSVAALPTSTDISGTGRTMTASAADMLAALALIHQLLGVRSPFGGGAPGGLDAALAKGSTSSTDGRERLSPSDVSVSAILSQ